MPRNLCKDRPEYSKFANNFVPHPHFEAAYTGVTDAISYSNAEDEPPCIHITGPSGVGKTTLRKKLAIEFAPVQDGRIIRAPGCPDLVTNDVPLLQFQFPENPTVISVGQEILKEYGDPRWYRGDRRSVTRRVDEAIASSGTMALLGDDAQRMVDRDGVIVKDELVDWIKQRHSRNRCAVVLVGLGRLRHLFEKDTQIERRWDAELRLEPYRWLYDDGKAAIEDQANFIGIVSALQKASPIRFSEALDIDMDDEQKVDLVALRFYYASQGIIGLLKKLHKMALRVAEQRERKPAEIDMRLLAEAFSRAFRSATRYRQNPFEARWSPFLEDGSVRLPPPIDDDSVPLHPLRRRRETKGEQRRELRKSLRRS